MPSHQVILALVIIVSVVGALITAGALIASWLLGGFDSYDD